MKLESYTLFSISTLNLLTRVPLPLTSYATCRNHRRFSSNQ